MTNKQIKQLAQVSYTSGHLDVKKVNRITKLLNRHELKTYLKYLKAFEKAKNVEINLTDIGLKTNLSKELRKLFPDKNVNFIEDPSLIAGLKIVDNDNIYDFSLKNTFKNLVSYINQ
jgi:F0F1-type ATP synthase delta subunit